MHRYKTIHDEHSQKDIKSQLHYIRLSEFAQEVIDSFTHKIWSHSPYKWRTPHNIWGSQSLDCPCVGITLPLSHTYAAVPSCAAVEQRDDCSVDRISLYLQQGQLEKANELLLSRRFNIYEGGEGRLTQLHGWLHTIWGLRCLKEGDLTAAHTQLENALVFPKNYGEGRHYSAQEGHIYYYLGLIHAENGNKQTAKSCLNLAAKQHSGITEVSYFSALALENLGDCAAAHAVLEQMLEAAASIRAHAGEYGYFGVGMPAPLPFTLDGTREKLAQAALLEALAYKGLGEEEKSRAAAEELKRIDRWNEKRSCFVQLGVL